MFDVGDLPVLSVGNCVLKPGVIKWPVKLYVRFLRFYVFFQNPKKHDFTFFELLHTFSRTLVVIGDCASHLVEKNTC